MPYDPFQLKVDVDAITASPTWADEKTRRDLIRQVGIDAKSNLDAESHKQLMDTLWQKAEPGLMTKAGRFVGTAVEEAVKSIPAAGGAAVFAATDALGLTDTGSGTRLAQGFKGIVDTAGQRIKQLDPNDRQEQRDALLESLREDLDTGAVPQGFDKWLSGEYDDKEIDDPDTKAFVDALVSSVSRAGVAADRMGDIDQEKLRAFMQSDRNPARADSDTPDEAGARQFLADYVATKDPQSWESFKKRVTETDKQYENRMRTATAQRREAEGALKAAPEGLAKEMITRSFSMQESPIDLASAAFPVLRGAKALQAARAGGAASALKGVGFGMAKEGAQEAGTEYLQDPRATATQIAEAGALGAVGSGVIEGGMAGAGALMRPRDLVTPTTPEEEAIVQTVEGSLPAPVVDTGFSPEEEANLSAVEKALTPTAVSPVATLTQEPGETGEAFMGRLNTQADQLAKNLETAAVQTAAANVDVLPATAAALATTAPAPAPAPAPAQTPAPVAKAPAASAPVDRASSLAPNLPPRATEAVPPRPQRQGRDTATRDAWDEQYGDMRKGGRSHNDDGSPYQPTLLDEVMVDVTEALYGATDEEKLASIGDQGDASASTTVMRLLNDGWVWDAKAKKLVNPANPAETPLQGVVRIRKQPAPTVQEAPTPAQTPAPAPAPATETLEQARARLRQGLSAEERAEDEGILADVFAEERQRATAREDAQRRLSELDAERARLEQEIAAQETPAPPSEPAPIVEETVPPEQPVPAVEEAPAVEADNIGEEADLITRQDIQKAQSKFLQFRGKSVGAGLAHMVKFPDGRVRKVTPFEWGRLNAPDETPEATIGLINENKLKKLTRHQSEQYGRYRFEAKRKGFTPSAAQVGETLDLLKKLNPPEGVTVYLRRLGRLDLLEPSQVAVEEAPAPPITEDKFPQTENVVAPAGEAEVGLGMEKKAKSFKSELDMSGVAYLNGDRWGIKQSSDGTFYVEQTVNGERKIVASNFPDIETAQVGAINAAFPTAVESIGTPVTTSPTREEGRIPRDEAPAQDNTPTDKALVKPVIRRTGSKVAGASVAGQQSAALNASRIATLKMLNDRIGAYPNEDFSGIDPAQINEVMGYMISLQLPQPAPPPPVQRDVTKPEQMTLKAWLDKTTSSLRKNAISIREAELAKRTEEPEVVEGNKSGAKILKSANFEAKANLRQELKDLQNQTDAQYASSIWRLKVADAINAYKPVTADIDNQEDSLGSPMASVLRKGYVRQGDLYVFQPTTPPTDAATQREIPENRVQERQAPDEGGPTPEAGGRNRLVEGRQVEAKGEGQEVAKPAAEVGTPVAGVLSAEEAEQLAKGKVPEGWSSQGRTLTDSTGKKWAVSVKDDEVVLTSGSESKTIQREITPLIKFSRSPEGKTYFDTIKRASEQATQEFPKPTADGFYHVDKNAAARDVREDELTVREGIPPNAVTSGRWALDISDSLLKSRDRTIALAKALGVEHTKSESTKKIVEKITALAVSNFKGPKASGFGSTNTVVTKETKDKAVKSLRKKIGGQTNIGGMVDPALLKDAVIVGTFYIEGGVRSFKDFSAKMIEEFGAGVQKYLRPAYDEIRKRTDIDTTGMDAEEGGEPAPKAPEPAAPPPPAEPPLPPAPAAAKPAPLEGPVSVANEPSNVAREQRGQPRLESPLRGKEAWDETLAKAEATMAADDTVAPLLIAELIDNPRNISSEEVAILLLAKGRRQQAFNKAVQAFLDAPADQKDAARAAMNAAEKALNEADIANSQAGSEQGRSLNARKMELAQDYSFENLLRKKQAAKEGPLSESDMRELKKQADEVAALTEEKEAIEASVEAKEQQMAAFNAALKEAIDASVQFSSDLKAQKRAVAKTGKTTTGKTFKEYLKEKEEYFLRRINARKSNLNMNLNPLALADYAGLMATYIAQGVVSVAELTTKFVGLFGKDIEPQIPSIKEAADNIIADEGSAASKADGEAKSYADQFAESEGEILSDRWVYNRVKEWLAEQDAAVLKEENNAEKLLNGAFEVVTKEVSKFHPDITERRLRDMFSGYGKTKSLDPADGAKKLRQMRRLELLFGKLERARSKVVPLRAGLQRDETTTEERDALRQLNDAMKDLDIGRAPSEQNVKTRIESYVRRLKNRRDDLKKQEEEGEREVRVRKTLDLKDRADEVKALKAEIKQIDAALDLLDPPKPPTIEQQIKDRLDNLNKQIKDLTEQRDTGKYAPAPNKAPITDEIQAKMDERDALTKAIKEAKAKAVGAAPPLTQEEINDLVISNLERQIRTVQKQIDEKNVATKAGLEAEDTPFIRSLEAKLKALREEKAQLKKDLGFGKKPKTDAELVAAAVKSATESVDELERRIRDLELEAKKRPSKTPETLELKLLRERRKELQNELRILRKAEEDAAKDPILEQIKKDRKYLERQIKNYEKRLAEGDFKPRTKKAKEYDKSLIDVIMRLDKAKFEIAKGLFEEKLKSRGAVAKTLDAAQQVLFTAKSFLTSLDFGGIFRQGNRITLSHPIRASREVLGMLKAFKSAEYYEREKKVIQDHPYYRLARQAGLPLTEMEGPLLSQHEDQFMSRYIEKVAANSTDPTWKKVATWTRNKVTGIPRASQRSHVMFLNKMRLGVFSELLEGFKAGAEPTLEEAKSVAAIVANFTGRADLGKGRVSKAANFLAAFIFSPQMLIANLQAIILQPLWKADARTRVMMAKEYARYLAGVTTLYALIAAAQDDDDPAIELDPRSSDFLKIRFGDTRLDPLGGLIQMGVFLSRLAAGETKRGDKIEPLRDTYRLANLFREVPRTDKVKFGKQDMIDVMARFARSKASPNAAAFVDFFSGKNMVGETVTPTDIALRSFTPIAVNDVVQSLKEKGFPDGMIFAALALTGVGTLHYNNQAKPGSEDMVNMEQLENIIRSIFE